MAVVKPSTLMREGERLLESVYKDNLNSIFRKSVDEIIRLSKKNNIKQVLSKFKITGTASYKNEVRESLSIISYDTWNNAANQLNLKDKKLSHSMSSITLNTTQFYNKLPPKVRRRLEAETELIIGSQVADAEKLLKTTYQAAAINTEDITEIKGILLEASEDYTLGPSIRVGAKISSAKTVNQVQNIFWTEKEANEIIKGFKFSNRAPETDICKELNGRTFRIDDKDYQRLTPPLHFNSVLEGTLIRTNEGNRPVESIKLGDLVLTHKNRFMPVTEVMKKESHQEYYVITLENNQNVCITGDHPILTQRGWVEVQDLNVLDFCYYFD